MLQALFRRAQLKALVTMHSIEENFGGHLSATEINIIGGALDLTNKTAAHGMTPLEKANSSNPACHPPTCIPLFNPFLLIPCLTWMARQAKCTQICALHMFRL